MNPTHREVIMNIGIIGGIALAAIIAAVPVVALLQVHQKKIETMDVITIQADQQDESRKEEPDYSRYGQSVVVPRITTPDQQTIIRWRGIQQPGASPLAVLLATKDQMQREQQSDLGNDKNAKALVLVMQAVAELEGKQTEMPDGTPIIQ